MDGEKKSDVFRLPAEAAARVKRIAFQASLDQGRRVPFAEIIIKGLDLLEAQLGTGKPRGRKRGSGNRSTGRDRII